MLNNFKRKRCLIGICSWKNSPLLDLCLSKLVPVIDFSTDSVACVLNQCDIESAAVCLKYNIPFVSVPENYGPLSIDHLKPFIERHDYFMNMNDDMFFAEPFLDKLCDLYKKTNAISISPILVEGGPSINPFINDPNLKNPFEDCEKFELAIKNKLYTIDTDTIKVSYTHPIMCKSADYLNIGGYSNNWDNEFIVGYGADDYFAYRLWKTFSKKPYMTHSIICYHGVSMTMKKLDQTTRLNDGHLTFYKKTGMSIEQFRQRIGIYEKI